MTNESHDPKVRKGQGSSVINHDEFVKRAKELFNDPSVPTEHLDSIIEGLWDGYDHNRKWPNQVAAGNDFENPDFKVGTAWLQTYQRLAEAKKKHHDVLSETQFLLINGSPRSDNTCPGEMSKTHRLCQAAKSILESFGKVEYLDLSRVTSEYGKTIHPCKSCVATAMPLCHWPCSCYPNQALGQTQDWMNEIYEMWMRAHGVMIITPVHWYSPTSVLKLMMDRMVCADGGNPDFTSTEGKNPEKAKHLELAGWRYPKHLASRRYSVIAHGDAEGARKVAESISSWLTDAGLISAGEGSTFDRYIGYYEPYATSHEALDRETKLFQEVEAAAQALAEQTKEYHNSIQPADAGVAPGLRRSLWKSGSETFGADHEVRPK